jgi:hypothetical protein
LRKLGRKLVALRDATPNNRRFGQAVRSQFDLHDPQDVDDMMRVARLYGDRPGYFAMSASAPWWNWHPRQRPECSVASSRPESWPARASTALTSSAPGVSGADRRRRDPNRLLPGSTTPLRSQVRTERPLGGHGGRGHVSAQEHRNSGSTPPCRMTPPRRCGGCWGCANQCGRPTSSAPWFRTSLTGFPASFRG